jgi:hypothetical protein
MVLGYGLYDRDSRVQFLAGAGNLSLHHHVHNGSGAHPPSYPTGIWGVKLTTHLQLVPWSKNEWNHTSISPIRLHGVVLS